MSDLSVVWSDAKPEWLAAIDFDQASLGFRDDSLQIRRVELPALDWTVFVVLSPMGHGLSSLNLYGPFEDALGQVFFASDHVRSDEPRRLEFDRMLRKLGIARKSNVALRCFGLYPRLWGDRYWPRKTSVRDAGRLLSIAVPSASADSTQRHLQRQVTTFGSRCISPAREEEILFWFGGNLREQNVEVLLENTLRLGADGRSRLVARLQELVNSLPARELFLAGLDGALRRGTLVNVPTGSCLVEGAEEVCHEIWDLRVELCSKLGFVAALDYVRQSVGEPGDPLADRYRKKVNGLLTPFSVIDENPLA
jgi:hypothetical protein